MPKKPRKRKISIDQLLKKYRKEYFHNPNSKKFIDIKKELDSEKVSINERNRALWKGP